MRPGGGGRRLTTGSVAIVAASEYEETLFQAKPLLEVIGKVIGAGGRQLPSSCSSTRPGEGGDS